MRPFLLLAVEALPLDQFHFKPRPGMFTAQQVIVHVAEAEYGWISNISALGTGSNNPLPSSIGFTRHRHRKDHHAA